MALVQAGPASRREAERVMVEEGQALWRQQREQRRLQQLREQKELQDMLARYSPWGRPGGGAPNSDTLRKRKMHVHELYPEGDKGRSATCTYSGHRHSQRSGGGAGGGGGGGGGAGGSAGLRSDAMLSFQANEAGHRAVDNVLRYRQPPEQQLAYRKELDALVHERRRQRQEEVNRCSERERWRGWSDEKMLRTLASRHFSNHNSEGESGGVELVPLLARRRTPSAPRHPLSSTDVTRVGEDSPANRGDWKSASARAYTQDLTQQVISKQQYQHRAQAEEMESCRRHFATWQTLWGRPGHGAPKVEVQGSQHAQAPALRRLNLDNLLRRLPVA